MRRLGPVFVAGVLLMSAAPSAAPQTSAAQALLMKARTALGGDWTFNAFRMSGTIKSRNFGESGRFEITCELPRRFLQSESRAFIDPGTSVDERGVGGASIDRVTVRLGFDGDEVIYEDNRYDPGTRYHVRLTDEQERVVLPKAREAFVNLTIGLFASSFPSAPVTFTDAVGPGSFRAVVVNGPDFTRTLVFGIPTGLPERFGNVRYEEYRNIDGRMIPSRIVVDSEQWIVKDFKILK